MQNFRQYIDDLKESLVNIYQRDEALSIAKFYVEEKLSLSSTDLFIKGEDILSKKDIESLKIGEERLLKGEPVQYVTNTAWFCDRKFYVDDNVLIPRQETEILIQEIVKDCSEKRGLKILDIGTGSGCIPISLKKAMPDSQIFALDISAGALSVAKKNAALYECDIEFFLFDILSNKDFPLDIKFDVIISNPPYVTDSEKNQMHENVTKYEPDLALYVRDSNPLVYYSSILTQVQGLISDEATIWFEINEKFADNVKQLCVESSFRNNVVIRDLNKKERFIKTSI